MKISTITEALDFEELFGKDQTEKLTIISIGEPKESPNTIKLYRGFNVNIDKLEKRGQNFVLSPKKSEQGLIWFTHKLIRGYDPIEYVSGRGSHILTYPLNCIKHYQEIEWSDGGISTRIPQEIMNKTIPTENCKFHMGIELPDGWVFSYKAEKFIGCSVDLLITLDMLRPDTSIDG